MTMSKWTADKVRSEFINYFVNNQKHTFIVSSSTIPHDDPTLLFANSGMTQFKPIFLGTVDPTSDFAKLKRAANTQKCIRAGGKHNDLDDVGKDVYHHTFFEMLGNWSFGDYFKKEAIQMAWDLLTNIYELPKDRLYVTYFGGDTRYNLSPDLEAKQLWIDIGVPEKNVMPYGMKENFWEMGDQGPCGPCSEIHFDRIGGRDASSLVNRDDPTVIEIWNLVFMQFNRESDGSLKSLPNKHVDTGMGFERLVSVLQGKMSNYDTDVFKSIFDNIQIKANCPAYQGRVGSADTDGVDTAYRVVADHIRTLTVSMSDGGMPSNEGRGYVLRRILRRAIRYSHEKLHAPPGFFASLVPIVVQQLSFTFPELSKCQDHIINTLQSEEMQFRKTLDRGLVQFDKFANKASNIISGTDAWRLYDTFGFPLDLTKLMAEERGLKVDEQGYTQAQYNAKQISKMKKESDDSNSDASMVDSFALSIHSLGALNNENISKTQDVFKYSSDDVQGQVLRIFSVMDQEICLEKLDSAIPAALLLSKTNFYAESGGQIYDTGILSSDDDKVAFDVVGVKEFGGYVLHIGYLKYGTISIGDNLICSFDENRRRPLRHNHTATHLLNHSIKKVLNSDLIDQKGSLVAPDRLRFDFTCNKPLSSDELSKIEEIVLEFIKRNEPVQVKEIQLSLAKSIHGLRAVFGEVYPDPVRVVCIGSPLDQVLMKPEDTRWGDASIELCGGTHVKGTFDIFDFCILQESAIAKGIRRIVAITGDHASNARTMALSFHGHLSTLEEQFESTSPDIMDSAIKSLSKQLEEITIPLISKIKYRSILQKLRQKWDDRDKAKKAMQIKIVTDELTKICQQSNEKFIVKEFQVEGNAKPLLQGIQILKNNNRAGLLLSRDASGKVHYYATVPTEIPNQYSFNALTWLDALSKSTLFNGKHGGREVMAQGCGEFDGDGNVDILVQTASKFAQLNINNSESK